MQLSENRQLSHGAFKLWHHSGRGRYCTCCLYIRPAHAPPHPAASPSTPAPALAASDGERRQKCSVHGRLRWKGGEGGG